VASLFATSSTLVCCAIPAALVALGAGAALSSLVSVFPQVVWLSEHKEGLFAFAGLAMAAAPVGCSGATGPRLPGRSALRDACLQDPEGLVAGLPGQRGVLPGRRLVRLRPAMDRVTTVDRA
jgi:urea transporter